ncbi:hypothetical protein [Phenylobacterium sp.]|uniref:hypothetical protein n=1 Tax=Phenylobacterium sp. TaxID=1871053 RepID=UPI0025E29E4C|nr:hypothetical protein [Phenylobacterium sp.]
MDEAARLLTLLAIVGAALTLVGGAFAWFLDETRRVRRTLTQALGAVPQPLLTARGRGVGIGFDLATGVVAVAWDKGGWRLTYRIDELMGVELVVDRRVAARAFRGEARRPLDDLGEPQALVRLRFVFDDIGHPDFQLDLWRPEDVGHRRRLEPGEALHEANRWVARIESLLRRPPAAAAPVVRLEARPSPAPLLALPLLADIDEDDLDDTGRVIT